MTAVTLSPHQLTNLQQQHQGLAGANNPSRTRTPTTHGNRTASFHHSGHVEERPEVMELSVGQTENRQKKISDQPGQRVSSEAHTLDTIQQSQDNLDDRSNLQHSSGAQESNSPSSTSEDQGQEGSKAIILEHEDSRLKTAPGIKKADFSAAHQMESLRDNNNTEAEVVPSAGRNGHGKRKPLPRVKSDLTARGTSPTSVDTTTEEENWELRHGWEDQYNSIDYLSTLTTVSRHISLARAGSEVKDKHYESEY